MCCVLIKLLLAVATDDCLRVVENSTGRNELSDLSGYLVVWLFGVGGLLVDILLRCKSRSLWATLMTVLLKATPVGLGLFY